MTEKDVRLRGKNFFVPFFGFVADPLFQRTLWCTISLETPPPTCWSVPLYVKNKGGIGLLG